MYGKPATVNWTKIALHLTMNAVLFQFIEPKKSAWQTRRNNMQMEKEKVGEPGIFSKLWKWGSMSAFLDYYLFLPYPPQLSLNRGREGINWVNRLKNSFVSYYMNLELILFFLKLYFLCYFLGSWDPTTKWPYRDDKRCLKNNSRVFKGVTSCNINFAN